MVDPARLVEACTFLRDEHGFNFLSDIAPSDYLGWGEQGVAGYIGTASGRDLNEPGSQGLAHVPAPKPKRFSVAYHLLRVRSDPARVCVQVWLDDGEPVASVLSVWPAADWFEREAWDMMGIPSKATRTSSASSCRRTGKVIRSARTTRSAASLCASRTRTECVSDRPPVDAHLRGNTDPTPRADHPRGRPGQAFPRRHPHRQLRAQPPLHPRCPSPDRRPRR